MDYTKIAVALGVGAAGLLAMSAALGGRRVRVHTRGGVIVTGASSGIGRHAAETLAAEGYTVFAGVRKDADGESLKKVCPAAVPLILDVTSQESVDKAMQTVRRHLSEAGLNLVALVNNAGVSCFFPAEFYDLDAVRAVYEVNVFGTMRMCKACIPLLRETGSGSRIVNIGSILGFFTIPGHSVYSSTKSAVQAISNAVRLELEQFGVWVCTINPGYVRTDIIHKTSGAPPPEEAVAAYGLVYAHRKGMRKGILSAQPPEVTSRAILHAVRSPRPWTRYMVASINGMPAWVAACLAWYLPKQWHDSLLLASIKAQHERGQ